MGRRNDTPKHTGNQGKSLNAIRPAPVTNSWIASTSRKMLTANRFRPAQHPRVRRPKHSRRNAIVEQDSASDEQSGSKNFERGPDHEEDRRDRGDPAKGDEIARAKDPIVDLKHVEGADEHQQVDEEAEHRSC